jgi:hypothetical protein
MCGHWFGDDRLPHKDIKPVGDGFVTLDDFVEYKKRWPKYIIPKCFKAQVDELMMGRLD